ncbi:MAG: HEAT repeat domain-containing protein [Verrucomicrobia bacterium]|nr:HEAT repeat domain-containing protein [Verrucomicrobiota bacterium]MDA1067972.1 HEAT repeat domain-containing protein [Verrucomicrobiota bacterium]
MMKRTKNSFASAFLFLASLIFGLLPTYAQRALTEIPNSDPAYQLSMLKAAEGFEISLFASDPMIAKPTSMAFDSKGRLFVTCTPIYPHVKPGEIPSDQVVRLEDTDGDGVADKSTVFADGLLIPTAVLANPEGVYVANSTELLFFTDKNDDGVADTRRIIYSGFGTEDTHHVIHTLRQGPDGLIYLNQSIYTHSHVETPYGYKDLQAGGVWQIRPETLELGVYSRGLVNTWGLQFDKWGQTFQTDGAGFEGIIYSFPGAAFLTNVGYERILPGLNPGQPKMSGLEIIDGPHFPDDWQGRLITNDFRGNRISTFIVSDSNSGFISEKQKDLVTSTHGAFRPIDLQNGPDGALYAADWYNPIIQHGEVDFRDERRDHEHGRIWRITAKDSPLQKSPDFAAASVNELLNMLKADNVWTRDHAKRQLKFRGATEVLPALSSWIKQLNRRDSRHEEFLLEGLWVSQSLDSVNTDALESLLDSKNYKARAAAIRVLEERPEQYEGIYARLESAIQDEEPRVRNEAIQVLRKLGTKEAARLVVRVLDFPMDENLDFSMWNTMRALQPIWLPPAKLNPNFFGANLKYLLYAIRSVEDEDAIQPLESLWSDGKIGDEEKPGAMVLLGERGEAEILSEVLSEAIELSNSNPSAAVEVLAALEASSNSREVSPTRGQETVIPLLTHPEVSLQLAAARLIGTWKLTEAIDDIESTISNRDTNKQVLAEAVKALVKMGSRGSRSALSDLANSELPVNTRMSIASGYASSDPRQAVSLVVKLLEGLGPEDDGTPLVVPYLENQKFPAILAKGLSGSSLNTQAATILLRRASTASIDTSELQAALQKAAGIEPVNQALSEDEMKAMIDMVENVGDPARGEQVYRHPNLLCAACHAIGGAGGTLGPDFTSIGASAPVDYLIDSLLQPQKQIKEGYHVVMVTKKDGTIAAGRLASENDTSVTLQDPADQLIEIPKSVIASQEISPISLMPPGLTASLRKDEFADLVKFLSRLGKEGDFNVTPSRLVRTYRYLDDKGGDKGYEDMIRHSPFEFVASDDPKLLWVPTYSMVDGQLPLSDFPAIRQVGREAFHYLHFYLDAKIPGDAVLKFNDSEQLVLFVGSEEVEKVIPATRVTLKPGVNKITVAINQKRSVQSLRIEVLDASNSAAQVQVVHGK